MVTSTRNPLISLQATLLPANDGDYRSRAEAITAFQNGRTFDHSLMGRVTPCSIWDYAVGDMIKFRYNDGKKVCFYRVIKSDFRRV